MYLHSQTRYGVDKVEGKVSNKYMSRAWLIVKLRYKLILPKYKQCQDQMGQSGQNSDI